MLVTHPRDEVSQGGRLSQREAYSYAFGEFAGSLTWNMFTGFILFYYSNIVLLPVAAVGTLLLLTRVLDAVIDPLVGVTVDRTRTRMGRARPWLVGALLPFILLTVLSFSVPNWSTQAKLIYAYVTFTLVGLTYSAVYVPYSAMLPLMTSDARDKLHVSSLRAMFASIGSIVIYGATIPLVGLLGGANKQLGFSLTAAIMASVAGIVMLIVFRNCRERAHATDHLPPTRIAHGLRAMIRNPVWLVVSAFSIAMFIRLGALVSVTAYFANDVLHAPWAIGVLLSSLSVSLLIGGFIARPWLARLGKRRGNLIALSFSIAMTIGMMLCQKNVTAFSMLFFIGNITLGVQSTTVFVLVADAVDTQEKLFGRRDEGLLTASVSFAQKVGMALGGTITAYGLAYVHYNPRAVTEAARDQISLLYFVGPALFAVLQMVIIALYNSDERGMAPITAKRMENPS